MNRKILLSLACLKWFRDSLLSVFNKGSSKIKNLKCYSRVNAWLLEVMTIWPMLKKLVFIHCHFNLNRVRLMECSSVWARQEQEFSTIQTRSSRTIVHNPVTTIFMTIYLYKCPQVYTKRTIPTESNFLAHLHYLLLHSKLPIFQIVFQSKRWRKKLNSLNWEFWKNLT